MSLMSLGLFVFELNTTPHQSVKRDTNYRYAKNSPVDAPISYQSIGEGEDTITLDGVLMPQVTGGMSNLDVLRDMAATGDSHLLMRGDGVILGMWVISKVSSNEKNLMSDGTAQRIEFSLTLERTESVDSMIDDVIETVPDVVDTTVTNPPNSNSSAQVTP